jgi:hypothetical protein
LLLLDVVMVVEKEESVAACTASNSRYRSLAFSPQRARRTLYFGSWSVWVCIEYVHCTPV